MCLDTKIEERYVEKRNAIEGYKVFNMPYSNKISGCYYPSNLKNTNDWQKDDKPDLYIKFLNLHLTHEFYHCGYHFFARLKDAEKAAARMFSGVIFKVKGAGTVTIGEDCYGKTYVATKLKLVKRVNNNRFIKN